MRCRGGNLGVGVGHIQSVGKAGLIAFAGDLGGMLLSLKVLAGDSQLLLQSPQVEVIVADLGHQADQHIAAILHGGLQIGLGGLDIRA